MSCWHPEILVQSQQPGHILCLGSGDAGCSAVIPTREASGITGQASWWRISLEQALVEDESVSIAEAGHWAGKGLEAGVGRWIRVERSIPSEAEYLGRAG